MGPVIIETDRLRLRQWTAEDFSDFAVLAKDAETMRYISGGTPHTDEQIRQFIERQLTTQSERGWSRWALQLREPAPGEPAGVIGFTGPGCTFAPDVEIGWWVRRDLWGRGLAQEAARAAVDHCFEVVGFQRLICCVHPDNLASLKVAEKTGFAPLDEIEFRGIALIRHDLRNPRPRREHDPRYIPACPGGQASEVRVVRTLR